MSTKEGLCRRGRRRDSRTVGQPGRGQAVCSNEATTERAGRAFRLEFPCLSTAAALSLSCTLHHCAHTPSLSWAICPSQSVVSSTESRYTSIY